MCPHGLTVAKAPAAEVTGRSLHGLLLSPVAGARWPLKGLRGCTEIGARLQRADEVSEHPWHRSSLIVLLLGQGSQKAGGVHGADRPNSRAVHTASAGSTFCHL